jgi:hypothetical protein
MAIIVTSPHWNKNITKKPCRLADLTEPLRLDTFDRG